MTDVTATPRRAMTALRRLQVFEAARGECYLCGAKIKAGEKWDAEHVRALGLGGADDGPNLAPVHVACHAAKTADDIRRITKAKRQKAYHIGAKKPTRWRRPPPGYGYSWKLRRYIRLEKGETT